MAVGEGKGKAAAVDAANAAVSNPLFDAPLDGAATILLNVRGGKDLALEHVHEIANIVRQSSRHDANILLGVVQDRRLKKRVKVTLIATGLTESRNRKAGPEASEHRADDATGDAGFAGLLATNGHATPDAIETRRLL